MKVIDKTRKLSKSDYKKYYLYLTDKFPICQVCESEKTSQVHHVLYGSYKNDKTIIAICMQCHTIAHSNKHKWESLLLPIAQENWLNYSLSIDIKIK